MIDYLTQCDILYKCQSGFRKKHSTDLCLSYLGYKILKGVDTDLLTGMRLTDLQKAFDTIVHNILLQKLNVIGFCDDTINWFCSYLTDWEFLVNMDSKYLSISKISCRVPERSISGPFLSLIYLNDIKKLYHQIYYYTSMTLALPFNINVTGIEANLNNDFSNLCECFLDNKLNIHFGENKNKSMLFPTKRKLRRTGKLNMT